jgi:hypothetical protein
MNAMMVAGSAVAHVLLDMHVLLVRSMLQMQHLQGIHTYGEGSVARQTARFASATRRERWRCGWS